MTEIQPFKVRFPAALRVKLDTAAEQSKRSVTAEVVTRLERSFEIERFLQDFALLQRQLLVMQGELEDQKAVIAALEKERRDALVLPDQLRVKIERSAKDSGRSVNSEIVQRLVNSVEAPTTSVDTYTALTDIRQSLAEMRGALKTLNLADAAMPTILRGLNERLERAPESDTVERVALTTCDEVDAVLCARRLEERAYLRAHIERVEKELGAAVSANMQEEARRLSEKIKRLDSYYERINEVANGLAAGAGMLLDEAPAKPEQIAKMGEVVKMPKKRT